MHCILTGTSPSEEAIEERVEEQGAPTNGGHKIIDSQYWIDPDFRVALHTSKVIRSDEKI